MRSKGDLFSEGQIILIRRQIADRRNEMEEFGDYNVRAIIIEQAVTN